MKTKTVLVSIALTGLALAQPLSAATRSADSLPRTAVQSSEAAERAGSPALESEELKRSQPILLLILLFGSLAALLLALGGGGDSRG